MLAVSEVFSGGGGGAVRSNPGGGTAGSSVAVSASSRSSCDCRFLSLKKFFKSFMLVIG